MARRDSSPNKQVVIRLQKANKQAFDKYAAAIGLDDSELAKLLIVRERNLGRLAALARRNAIPKRPRQKRGTKERLPTVTAHFASRSAVDAFIDYAKDCGLSVSSAGAWLLEHELEERWLEQALHS